MVACDRDTLQAHVEDEYNQHSEEISKKRILELEDSPEDGFLGVPPVFVDPRAIGPQAVDNKECPRRTKERKTPRKSEFSSRGTRSSKITKKRRQRR